MPCSSAASRYSAIQLWLGDAPADPRHPEAGQQMDGWMDGLQWLFSSDHMTSVHGFSRRDVTRLEDAMSLIQQPRLLEEFSPVNFEIEPALHPTYSEQLPCVSTGGRSRVEPPVQLLLRHIRTQRH